MTTINWFLAPGDVLADYLGSTVYFALPDTFRLGSQADHFVQFSGTGLVYESPDGPPASGATATGFVFIYAAPDGAHTIASSLSGFTVDLHAFYQYLLVNGAAASIDYLFGTLGSGGNLYQGSTGSQIFQAYRNDDSLVGGAGDDVFDLGRLASVTDIGAIHGHDTTGGADAATDTLRFVAARNLTIHAISNIDVIEFNAAANVTFALTDTNASGHALLQGLTINGASAGASMTFNQMYAGATSWNLLGWSATGEAVDLTINTYDDDFNDAVYIDLAVAQELGDVVINTHGGNDSIQGGGAHVTIDGGAGIDTIALDGTSKTSPISFDFLNTPNWAAFGLDSVSNVERASLSGGSGNDTLTGGNYHDVILGNGGDDLLKGGDGTDLLQGGLGNDTLQGEDGDDAVDGRDDDDVVYGGAGNDQVDGSGGNDTLYGGTDDDALRGGLGADSMDGGDGNDILSYGTGNAGIGIIISLGSGGIDVEGEIYPDLGSEGVAALIAIAGASDFTLAAGTARDGDGSIDHFTNVENVSGSSSADFIIGSDAGQDLYAGYGDDWVYGQGGADLIYADSGLDHVYGGTGADSLYGGGGDDTLTGGAGNDTIDGDDGAANDGTGDTAVYAGAWKSFTITGTSTLTIASAAEGTDTVTNVEYFTFNGVTVAAADLFNEGPVGVDDTDAVTEASESATLTPIDGDVLGNDTDPNSLLGDTKTITGIRAGDEVGGGSMDAVTTQKTILGTYGTLTIKADGSYTYTLDSSLPATQAIIGGGTAHDVFTYEFADAAGETDTAQLDITVRDTNDAPTGTDKTITLTEDGAPHTFSASDFGFIDTDGNAFQSVTITSVPATGSLKLNGVTVTLNQVITVGNIGLLVYTPAPDGAGSPYASFGFKVTDNGGTANSGANIDAVANTIRFDVDGVNDAPVIGSNSGGPTASVTINENTRAVTTVAATDIDSGSVTYAIAGGADAALFKINSATGALAFITAPNREAPTDANHNNVYEVTVQASDGSLTDTQAIAVTVANVNEAPVIGSNGGGGSAAITINENTKAVTSVAATDVDSGTVTYAITGGNDAALFKINSATGALAFIAAPNREAPTDANHNNVYEVAVRASDGTLTDTQVIAVTVANVNEAPVITSNGGTSSAAINVNENLTAVTTVTVSDDGPGKTFSLTGADAALFKVSGTGVVTFKAAPDFEAPKDQGANNVYKVTLNVSDGTLTDLQNLTITVKNLAGNTISGTTGNDTVDATHKISNKGATGEEDKIDGKAGDDTLSGLGGNDTLIGGTGKDALDGGAGADTFVFNARLNATTNVDTIKTFEHDSDVIQLATSIFGAIGPSLTAGEFVAAAGATAAADANDRIIYNKTTGKLYYDDDGLGGHAAIHFATLTNKPQTLDHGDFSIV